MALSLFSLVVVLPCLHGLSECNDLLHPLVIGLWQDNINKAVSKGNSISTSQFMCFHNVWAALILAVYVAVDVWYPFGHMSSLVRHC